MGIYKTTDPTYNYVTMPRLYSCWQNMKTRARRRKEACHVFGDWGLFPLFAEWSLSNGYSDNMVLCRNKDKGDYSPTNARWGTVQENAKDKVGMKYRTPLREGVQLYTPVVRYTFSLVDKAGKVVYTTRSLLLLSRELGYKPWVSEKWREFSDRYTKGLRAVRISKIWI